mmetsp:Transcript_1723/g.3291  ORF Transcript_1723/g.3291 Transcript_1723/m.3291 type:complete len:213 (+) Transcript_1723:432-1070(+)
MLSHFSIRSLSPVPFLFPSSITSPPSSPFPLFFALNFKSSHPPTALFHIDFGETRGLSLGLTPVTGAGGGRDEGGGGGVSLLPDEDPFPAAPPGLPRSPLFSPLSPQTGEDLSFSSLSFSSLSFSSLSFSSLCFSSHFSSSLSLFSFSSNSSYSSLLFPQLLSSSCTPLYMGCQDFGHGSLIFMNLGHTIFFSIFFLTSLTMFLSTKGAFLK